jgi:hypothetical protein
MKISLRDLHNNYCKELNALWRDAVKGFDGLTFDQELLKPFVAAFREAEKDGYGFNIIFDPFVFIDRCILDSEKESEMLTYMGWNDINVINNMRSESIRQGWKNIVNPLDKLKTEKARKVTLTFLENLSKQDGPFFPGKDASEIQVYCMIGNVGLEMALISIIHSSNPSA